MDLVYVSKSLRAYVYIECNLSLLLGKTINMGKNKINIISSATLVEESVRMRLEISVLQENNEITRVRIGPFLIPPFSATKSQLANAVRLKYTTKQTKDKRTGRTLIFLCQTCLV